MVCKNQFPEGPLGRSSRLWLYQERVVCPKIAAKWTNLAPISLYLSERWKDCDGFEDSRRIRTFRFAKKKNHIYLMNSVLWKQKRMLVKKNTVAFIERHFHSYLIDSEPNRRSLVSWGSLSINAHE